MSGIRTVLRGALALPAITCIALLVSFSQAKADLLGHGGPVRAVTINESGTLAATASFDYAVIVWDLTYMGEVHRLIGHEAAVNSAAFVPGNRSWLVTAGDDGLVLVWDWQTGELVHRFDGHTAKVAKVAVSHDGRWAASASWDHSIRLWDLQNLTAGPILNQEYEGHEGRVSNVAWRPSEGFDLVTTGTDGAVRLWSSKTGQPTGELGGNGFPIMALDVTPDGRFALTASADETIRLWDLEQQEELERLKGHDGPVLTVAFAPLDTDTSADPNGWPDIIAAGGADGRLRVWQRLPDSEQWHRRALDAEGPVWDITFTPDRTQLMSAGIDDIVRVWNLKSGDRVPPFINPQSAGVPGLASGEPTDNADPALERGRRLFATCRACHTVTPDDGRRAGPTLHGVFGRVAGGLNDYPYSEALIESHLVWTRETIGHLFDAGPDQVLPGTKMPVQRIANPEDRAALLDYMEAVTQPNS